MSQEVSHRSPQLRYPSAGLLRRYTPRKDGLRSQCHHGFNFKPRESLPNSTTFKFALRF